MNALSSPYVRSALGGLVLFLIALKFTLVLNMSLFGDEAFYWLESIHPAISYSDLPPLTAGLIRLGTALFGDSYLAVRSLFFILGCAIPLAIYLLAREFVDRQASCVAALLSLCLPLVTVQGVLALPDAPLNIIAIALLLAATRAIRSDSLGWWMVLGLCAALGLATHFRMAVPLLALVGFFLVSGRSYLASPGPWLAVGLAFLGLLPTLIFNLQHDFASFNFQLVERHPWSFQGKGLLQPLQQIMVTTPLLYGLLVGAAVLLCQRARNAGGEWTLLAWAALFPPLFYFGAGLFADQTRANFHWPLVGYLPLCVMLPEVLSRLQHYLRRYFSFALAWSITLGAPLLGLLAGVAAMGFILYATTAGDFRVSHARGYPDNLLGWREAAAVVEQLRREQPGDGVLLADNFMLAAELSFELGGRPVFSLDHPLNTKYGRAAQLAIWGLDELAWQETAASDTLLVIETSAVKGAQLTAWLHRICERLGGGRLQAELSLHGGRKRFLFYRQDPQSAGSCDFPAISYLDRPADNARLSGDFMVVGWAFEDNQGVASVDIQIDGRIAGRAHYGLPRPDVADFFPRSTDPQHPAVGFELSLDSSAFADGRHELVVVTTTHDGGVHYSRATTVQFDNGAH